MLTIFGNTVLIGFFAAVSISIQENNFKHSSDIRIGRDIFVPVIVSTTLLFFTSLASMLMLVFRNDDTTLTEDKMASFVSAGFRLTLIACIFIFFSIPFMAPKFQTRYLQKKNCFSRLTI